MLGPTGGVDRSAECLVELARHLFGTARAFIVDGQPYVAIAQDSWVERRESLQCDRRFLGRVAGGMIISGKRHIVLDCAAELQVVSTHPSIAQILTRRELQVALMVSEGGGDKDIARQLGISSYTVREHMRRVFNKLGVSKRSAVVARVLGAAYSGVVCMGEIVGLACSSWL